MALDRLATLIAVVIVCGVLSSIAVATGNSRTESRRDSVQLTLFAVHRPGLNLKLWASKRRIVGDDLSSRVTCEGGHEESGSGTIVEHARIRIRHDGHFKYSDIESYEDDGSYFTGLVGKVRRNTVKGFYRAWEEREGEEGEFLPKCGTLSPRGKPVDFEAHRVSGPPWRP